MTSGLVVLVPSCAIVVVVGGNNFGAGVPGASHLLPFH